jgi:hypothetical protein
MVGMKPLEVRDGVPLALKPRNVGRNVAPLQQLCDPAAISSGAGQCLMLVPLIVNASANEGEF